MWHGEWCRCCSWLLKFVSRLLRTLQTLKTCRLFCIAISVDETIFSSLTTTAAYRVFNLDNGGTQRRINHEHCAVYLGVLLDRFLSMHTTKTAAKIKSRNNIIAELPKARLREQTIKLCGPLQLHCVILLLTNVFSHEAVLLTPNWWTDNLMKPCASSPGLYIWRHSSVFQYYPTLLLQPSNVLKQLQSSSTTCTFLFTQTSSIIRRLACNPVDRYGPQTQGLQWMNYGEKCERLILR